MIIVAIRILLVFLEVMLNGLWLSKAACLFKGASQIQATKDSIFQDRPILILVELATILLSSDKIIVRVTSIEEALK